MEVVDVLTLQKDLAGLMDSMCTRDHSPKILKPRLNRILCLNRFTGCIVSPWNNLQSLDKSLPAQLNQSMLFL